MQSDRNEHVLNLLASTASCLLQTERAWVGSWVPGYLGPTVRTTWLLLAVATAPEIHVTKEAQLNLARSAAGSEHPWFLVVAFMCMCMCMCLCLCPTWPFGIAQPLPSALRLRHRAAVSPCPAASDELLSNAHSSVT